MSEPYAARRGASDETIAEATRAPVSRLRAHQTGAYPGLPALPAAAAVAARLTVTRT
jgi:hypothetical protein